MAGGSSNARTVSLIAAAAIVIGSIGPWVTSPLVDRAGTDGDGIITLILGVLVGTLILIRRPGSRWLWLATALGVLCLAIGLYDLADILSEGQQEIFGQQVDLVDPGWGLWLMNVASIAFVIASWWYYVDRAETQDPDRPEERQSNEKRRTALTFTVSRKVLYVLGGIGIVVLAGVLGAAIADGGSNPETTTVVETVEVEAEAASEETEAEEAENISAESEEEAEGDCDELGINPEVGKEGTCTSEGLSLVVVDKESMLKLRELNLQLLGMETQKTVTGEFGETKSANGVFVIFDLEVTNKTSSPVYFDSNQEQAVLFLGDNEYTEDFEVENWALDDSFVNKFEEIQPETSTTGSIAFDVPPKLLPDLKRTANLDILNFSDEGQIESTEQLGVIRTYK